MIPNLVEYVLSTVNPNTYYKLKYPEWTGDSNISCPFTDKHASGTDKNPSFSVNINGTGGCFCHSCGTKVASIIHHEKLSSIEEELDDEGAAAQIYHQLIHPVMASAAKVEAFLAPNENALAAAPLIVKKLVDELKITQATVKRFKLGWDTKARRVTIPIIDRFGQLVNIRRYRLPSMRDDDKFPKILNTEGFGKQAEMFPAQAIRAVAHSRLKPAKIFWFTGERDTLLAWDKGLPAFCYATGESVCRKEWMAEIKLLGAHVGIVQDNDDAGIKGAQKRLAMLEAHGISSSIVTIPDKNSKDFSDFIINGGTIQEFLELTKKEVVKEKEPDFHPVPKIIDPLQFENLGVKSVYEIGRDPTLLNRPITVRALVSGKMDRTYSIPYIYQVGEFQFKLPVSREMLQLVRENDANILKLISQWLNTKSRVLFLDYLTITEVEIIPMIQPGIDALYTNQRCYFIGPIIECNKPYEMVIVPTTDMRTQETIGLITSIIPVSNVLDSYSFTEGSCKQLIETFQPEPTQDPLESLYELAHSVSQNHTRIYNRDDLHVVALLTWLSPLEFVFPYEGAQIERGWLNSLILGDTQTGKSKICQKLTTLFRCGVFINAESCSYVGLVGGAVKSSSGMFLLRWGKIPLYNRQLVIVEELSGLTTEEISYMSEVRSAGVARYDKAGLTGETSAKTRLICLSNVRAKGKSLGDYPTGVQAALELVGQNEDVSRFDFILTATDDEVDSSIINKDRSQETLTVYGSEEIQALQDLVMFTWSLKVDQINFTIGAYQECLKQTLLLSTKYHPSIPIFKAGSGRLLIARIALAIACVQMSWCLETKKLVVKEIHVVSAAKLLMRLYAKPSFGYLRYSTIQYNLERVLNESDVYAKVEEIFKGKEREFYQYVSNSANFSKFDIADALGVHHMFAERIISQFYLSNLAKKGDRASEWTLSRAGRKWIEAQLTKK